MYELNPLANEFIPSKKLLDEMKERNKAINDEIEKNIETRNKWLLEFINDYDPYKDIKIKKKANIK